MFKQMSKENLCIKIYRLIAK